MFREAVEGLERDGIYRLRGMYTPARMQEALDRVVEWYERCGDANASNASFLNRGQPMIYNLQNKDAFFLDLIFEHALVQDILIHFLNRGARDYRTNPENSYRIGYAESADGVSWTRMDERAGICLSTEGWDSQMLAYAHVYEHAGRLHMVYNGNGFGRSGFGHAVADVD